MSLALCLAGFSPASFASIYETVCILGGLQSMSSPSVYPRPIRHQRAACARHESPQMVMPQHPPSHFDRAQLVGPKPGQTE